MLSCLSTLLPPLTLLSLNKKVHLGTNLARQDRLIRITRLYIIPSRFLLTSTQIMTRIICIIYTRISIIWLGKKNPTHGCIAACSRLYCWSTKGQLSPAISSRWSIRSSQPLKNEASVLQGVLLQYKGTAVAGNVLAVVHQILPAPEK